MKSTRGARPYWKKLSRSGTELARVTKAFAEERLRKGGLRDWLVFLLNFEREGNALVEQPLSGCDQNFFVKQTLKN
jgi:hypothetical protein